MSHDTTMAGIANRLALASPPPAREMWHGSQYAPMLDFSGARKSDLGRRIVRDWLREAGFGAEEVPEDDDRLKRRPGLSALLLDRDRLALTKLSMLRANRTVLFQHLSVEKDHDWDGALLLAIAPTQAHLWYVPRRILMTYTSPQHSRTSRCIAFRLDDPPQWLAHYGGRLDWAVAQWQQRKGADDAV